MSERCRHPGAASGILWDLKPGSSLAPPPLRENSPFPAASPGPRSEDLSHGKLEQLPRESWRIPAREKSRIAAGRTGGWILGRRSDSHHLALPRIPDLAWEPARPCLEFLGNSPFFFFPPVFLHSNLYHGNLGLCQLQVSLPEGWDWPSPWFFGTNWVFLALLMF